MGGSPWCRLLGAVLRPQRDDEPAGRVAHFYTPAVLLPSLGVSVRRLHDTDRWWLLIGLLPSVGAIGLLGFYATAGTRGQNSHGADPKALTGGAAY